MPIVKGHSVPQDHYINGDWVKGDETYSIFSPIDQTVLGEMPVGTAANVDAAITGAQNAFPEWSALGAEGRLPFLQRFAEEIGKRKDAFCEVESTDAGILLSRLQHGIIPRSMLNITWFAEAALTLQDRIIDTPQAQHFVRHDPAGVYR